MSSKERNTEILLPPQALAVEKDLLGMLLTDSEVYFEISPIIATHEAFYSLSNQKIYQAIEQLQKNGSIVDLHTVTEQVRKNGDLKGELDAYYITSMQHDIKIVQDVRIHAAILAEKHKARVLIGLCNKVAKMAYKLEVDIFDILDETEKEIRQLQDTGSIGNLVNVGKAYVDLLEAIENHVEVEGLSGIDTGYSEINLLNDGWQVGELIILAARPGVGKTAMLLNFLMAAANAGSHSLIFSREMTVRGLITRLAATKSGVYMNDIKKRKVTAWQNKKLHEQIQYFANAGIQIDDKTSKITSIIATIRQAKKKNAKLKLIGIDYIQLVKGIRENGGNREQEVASISRELKLIANELDLTIIALSQLNRDNEKTPNKKPTAANLRESGALEQDADMILLIWKQEITDSENNLTFKHTLCIPKYRNGSVGDIDLHFNADLQKWESLEPKFTDVNTDTTLPDFSKIEYKEPPENGTKPNDMFSGFQPYQPRKGLNFKDMDSWLTDI